MGRALPGLGLIPLPSALLIVFNLAWQSLAQATNCSARTKWVSMSGPDRTRRSPCLRFVRVMTRLRY